jgi:putative transposase
VAERLVAGRCRPAWRATCWGLAIRIAAYERGEKAPNAIELHQMLNQLKRTDVPWMYGVSQCAPQEALRNLDTAYVNLFRRVKLKNRGCSTAMLAFSSRKRRSPGWGAFG